jgi:hypothetical protein
MTSVPMPVGAWARRAEAELGGYLSGLFHVNASGEHVILLIRGDRDQQMFLSPAASTERWASE